MTGLPLTPPADDPLGVLGSTAPVLRDTELVRVDADAVRAFAARHVATPPPALAEDELHCTFLPPRRFLNYLLALEAMNFCFWDEAPRWVVPYQGARHDGYWALAAALHRAIRVDAVPVWDAQWLAEADIETVAHLLRGEGNPPPLLEARAAHLREAGRALLARWEGQFANVVGSCGGDAMRLVSTIVAEFPSFRDVGTWRGKAVRFYKRAQICVADLSRMLPDPEGGPLRGLEALTAFADYKVPQVLRKAGILVLNDALAREVDAGAELPADSEGELAIRAGTIWACHWLAEALGEARPDGPPVTAMDVDYLLWAAGQDKTGLPPYHRTRTIFY